MKKWVSLFFLINVIVAYSEEKGLLFWTDFNFFNNAQKDYSLKEKNYKKEAIVTPPTGSLVPDLGEGQPTPSLPGGMLPDIEEGDSAPPITENKYIFYNNKLYGGNFVISNYLPTVKDLVLNEDIQIGMGSLFYDHTLVNQNIVAAAPLDNRITVGILGVNGGNVINSKDGEVISGSIFGFGIVSDKDSTALNEGNVNMINGIAGMYGNNSSVVENKGILNTYNTSFGIYGDKNSVIINNGTVTSEVSDYDKTYFSMFTNGGLAINDTDGVININLGDQDFAMGANNGGLIVNKGKINVDTYENGMLLVGNSKGYNEGIINLSGVTTGVYIQDATKDTLFVNDGLIKTVENGADYAIRMIGDGTVKNNGTISLTRAGGGLELIGNGLIENSETGVIDVDYLRNPMLVRGEGTLLNNGTINIKGIDTNFGNSGGAMYVSGSGTAINNGIINVDGVNYRGLASDSNGMLLNDTDGLITIAENSKGNAAFYSATGVGINKGTVDLGNTGKVAAENSGSVHNFGTIIVDSSNKESFLENVIMEVGGEVDIKSGENTELANQTITLGLSYLKNAQKNENIISVDSEILNKFDFKSNSILYSIIENEDSLEIEKNSIKDLEGTSLGDYLENAYGNQNSFISDILASSSSNEEFNGYLDKIFGKKLYSSLIYQNNYAISFLNNKILDKLTDEKNLLDKNQYIIGYSFDKNKTKTVDNILGYSGTLNSFFVGKNYSINSNLDLGGILSYGRLNIEFEDELGERDNHIIQGNMYAKYKENDLQYFGSLYFGYMKGSLERNLEFDYLDYNEDVTDLIGQNVSEKIKSDLNTYYVGALGEISKYKKYETFYIKPFARVESTMLFQKSMGEKADRFGMELEKFNGIFNTFSIGSEVGKEFIINDTKFKLSADIQLKKELNSVDENLKFKIKDISDETGSIDFDNKNSFSQEIGLKLEASEIVKDTTFHIGYRKSFSKDGDQWKADAGFTYRF